MIVPCERCLVYPVCKLRYISKPKFFMDEKFETSIYNLAYDENCPHLLKFLNNSDQDGVNRARGMYNMEPYA